MSLVFFPPTPTPHSVFLTEEHQVLLDHAIETLGIEGEPEPWRRGTDEPALTLKDLARDQLMFLIWDQDHWRLVHHSTHEVSDYAGPRMSR